MSIWKVDLAIDILRNHPDCQRTLPFSDKLNRKRYHEFAVSFSYFAASFSSHLRDKFGEAWTDNVEKSLVVEELVQMLSLTPSRKMFAIILGAVSMCLVQPRLGAGALGSTSIVFAVDYTLDGRANEDAGNAIETYLQFVLSRVPYGKPQRMEDYNQDCKSRIRVDDPDRPCPLPDLLIQVQSMSAKVSFKFRGQPAEMSSLRANGHWTRPMVKFVIYQKACGALRGVSSELFPRPRSRRRRLARCHCMYWIELQTNKGRRRRAAITWTGPSICDVRGIQVCGALAQVACISYEARRIHESDQRRGRLQLSDGLQNIASIVNAAAVLTGTVYPDDQGGLFVAPYW